MAQRKLDVVLDSVKRLLRMGATANLVNLLQKQHPADLAQLFSELPDKERQAAFSLLAERNGRLAMEALSELGPETGAALLADRSAEEIAKLAQEIPSDDAAALIDYLPEELSAAVLELMQKRPAGGDVGEPARVRGADGRPHHEPEGLRPDRRHDGRRIDHRAAGHPRRRDGLLPLRRRRAPASGRRGVAAAAAARLAGHAAQADHDGGIISVRVDMDQEEVARQVASYNLLAIPVVDEENKLVGVITVDDVIDVIKDEATEDIYRLAGVAGDERVFTPAVASRCGSGCRG